MGIFDSSSTSTFQTFAPLKDAVSSVTSSIPTDRESVPPPTMQYNIAKPPAPTYSNIFSIVTNIRDTGDYFKGSLIDGRDCNGRDLTLGNRFFLKSGKCDNVLSVPECRGQSRYMYIDNVPTSIMPCIDLTQPVDPLCSQMGNGLFTGVVQDVLSVNPFELIASAAGQGSVINDTCVSRTELVGFESNGVKQYTSETKCAPPNKPLICSMSMTGMPECPLYDKNDKANLSEKLDSYNPSPYLIEMTNQAMQSVLDQAITSIGTTIPQESAHLPIDKYDTVWHIICQIVHNKWIKFLTGSFATPSFIMRMCCMCDKIQCTNDILLYQWYATEYRTNYEYGFQIKWKAYYNQNTQQSYIQKGDIVGNPMPTDLDTPVTVTVSGTSTVFKQIEGFTNPASNPSQKDTLSSNRPSRPLFGACVVTRILVCLVAVFIPLSYLSWMGYAALLPSFAFFFVYVMKLRPKGMHGQIAWWNQYRPLHGMMYMLFAIFAIHRIRKAYFFLFIDILLGIIFFMYHTKMR